MTSLLARWRGKLREFGPAQDGNIAITFAAFSLPMILFLGWAVDYSIGNSAKASMQAALDATGLSLSKEAQKLNNGEALNAKALKYFLANFNRPDVKNVTITPTFTDLDNGRYKLELSAAAQVPTSFTGMWKEYMDIGSETQVIWGYKKLELALALDNTGSMSSNKKMEQLKTAAKNLLDTLKKAAKKDGDIRVSIVPFSTDVNVGKSNFNADWIKSDTDSDSWKALNGTCSKSGKNTNTESGCKSSGGNWTSKTFNSTNWNGCVWDRNQNDDVKNTTPEKNIKATLFPAHQASNCPVTMLPLTYDWNMLTSKIDAMIPTGNTNVTIGMAMAFQTLSPVAPFNARAPAIDLDKVIILLTDGENTESRFSSSAKTIDKRTKLACDNAKAANIKVYTIRVINGNSSLLQQCATKSDMYYDVQDASQLNTVFVTIANSLASLRLAQ